MNCREVQERLVAYLDGEVAPSERALIRAHLAGCDACGRELAALSATQNRVRRSLQVRAAQAAPSPQAWSRLQARLAGEARPSLSWLPAWLQRLAPDVGRISQNFQLRGGITMKKGFAFATLVALVIALGTVAFVPSVRAQVGEAIARWFHFHHEYEVPGGEVAVEMWGQAEFTPLYPTYLPSGVRHFLEGNVKDKPEALRQVYGSEDWFVEIIQTKALADRALPTGREVTVNDQQGVLVRGLSGAFELIPEIKVEEVKVIGTPPATPIGIRRLSGISIPYDDGKRLIWYVGDVRLEMLSNLPEEEMLKIAESMVPAEAGEGEAPFKPPLDLPSGGKEKVIETEGGRIIIQEEPIESKP